MSNWPQFSTEVEMREMLDTGNGPWLTLNYGGGSTGKLVIKSNGAGRFNLWGRFEREPWEKWETFDTISEAIDISRFIENALEN